VQPSVVRDALRQPHRPSEVFAEQRVGLWAAGDHLLLPHVDDDRVVVLLVDLGGHLESVALTVAGA
jgi:hypothetical protein